ncbi:MAG: ribosomal protein S18-alanine N-acetyltransferase [Deltaproteobacteria bacterium]|nr:ribosomal protein S18-alanine N-acetyltransferase [Deltaproteobacteria bacterium]
MEIEEASFSSPWDRNTFVATLEDDRCKNVVACIRSKIVGYCLALEMNTMIHLLNLAVHPDYRYKGIAVALLGEILSFAKERNKVYVFLEVRKSNKAARCLYETQGFRHVSTWHRYYTDTGEDADVMIKKLGQEG